MSTADVLHVPSGRGVEANLAAFRAGLRVCRARGTFFAKPTLPNVSRRRARQRGGAPEGMAQTTRRRAHQIEITDNVGPSPHHLIRGEVACGQLATSRKRITSFTRPSRSHGTNRKIMSFALPCLALMWLHSNRISLAISSPVLSWFTEGFDRAGSGRGQAVSVQNRRLSPGGRDRPQPLAKFGSLTTCKSTHQPA